MPEDMEPVVVLEDAELLAVSEDIVPVAVPVAARRRESS
jgi:hypothetical protein